MAGKRSHGEGYVKQLKSGNWRGQLMDGYTDEGKKKIVSFTGPTRKDVVAQMRDYRTQRDANLLLNRDMTFQTWSDRWYEGYQDQVQPSTYCNYRYTLNILQNHFGSKKLIDILPLDIESFIRTMSSDYSGSQLSKCRSMLIQIFDAAEANSLLSRNPARKAKKPRRPEGFEPERKEKDAFTDDEAALLMVGLEDDLIGNSIRVMLGTGIRPQEVVALSREDIAEDGSTLRIDKAVKTVNGKSELGPPKSRRGNRVIPVPNPYRPAARYLRTHGRSPFLWTSSWKNPLCTVKYFRTKYYKAIGEVEGVRLLSPHCCRHTYITRLQAKGVPMETIARLVGHSKIETTDHYLHTSTETLTEAVSVLDDNKEGYHA